MTLSPWPSLLIGEPIQATEHGSSSSGDAPAEHQRREQGSLWRARPNPRARLEEQGEQRQRQRAWLSLFIGEPVQATEHGSTSKGGCTSGKPDGESRALSGEPVQALEHGSRNKGSSAKDREHGSLSLSVSPSKVPSMARQARGTAPAEHQMERAGLSLASLPTHRAWLDKQGGLRHRERA
jgi:hypothetical protein